jgi:hypothetical protein
LNSDPFGEGLTIVASAAFLGAVLAAVIFITPVALLGFGAFAGYHLYAHNPKRKERIAREHTLELYRQATQSLLPGADFDLEYELGYHLPGNLPESVHRQLIAIGERIYRAEKITPDIPEPPAICNSIEGARYRDMIARASQVRSDAGMARSACHMISEALATVAVFSPTLESDLSIPITATIDDLPEVVNDVILTFFQENDYSHFKDLKLQLDANFNATHRTNPIYPNEYKGDDVIEKYLKRTPLLALFDVRVPFAVPEHIRFEHSYILGATGSGKTTAMKQMIARDLADVSRGSKSVVVIDSKGSLIPELLNLDFPNDRIVHIDPDDIQFPVSLNLFDTGQERFDQYSALEREQLRNSLIELYEFVMASLLDTGMTGQQQIIFRYILRLMLAVPGATLHHFVDVLEDGGKERYQRYIDKLEDIPRRFFESQFDDNEFKRMRKAVLRRLYLILENAAFERMFRDPKCKLDLFAEMNAGKLILISTSKATLKEQGTATFGRFFIALIAQAASERAMIADYEKTPTFVYIDEAHEYLDSNVSQILAQAREQKIGLIMAHQHLGQIRSPEIRASIEANTAIKLAGNVSASDANLMARQMNCEPATVQNQPTFSFMTFVRGITNRGVPVMYPPGALDAWGQRHDLAGLRDEQRARYASDLSELDGDDEDDDGNRAGEDEPEPPPPDDDPPPEPQAAKPDEPPAQPSAEPTSTATVSAKPKRRRKPAGNAGGGERGGKDTGDEEKAAKW